MSGAVDCLEFLPDELVVEVSRGLAGCADDLPQCKRLLYEVLAKHYGNAQQPPLFSNHVFDIHSGISELLGKLLRRPPRRPADRGRVPILILILSSLLSVNGKQGQALETLQLGLKLQDSRSREELRRLLRFMAIAARVQEVKLHKEVSAARLALFGLFALFVVAANGRRIPFQTENRMAVKRSFSSAIVYSRRLSKGKVDLMVLFMVDNHCDLFKVSGPMKRQLYNRRLFLKATQPVSNLLRENVDHPFFVPIFPKQIPVSLHKLVSDRIMSIMKGNDPNVTTGLPILLSLHVAFALAAVPLTVPGQLSCLLSLRRLSVLHEGDCKGLLRKRTKMHQGGTLVFAAHNPREPQAGRQGEEEAPGAVL